MFTFQSIMFVSLGFLCALLLGFVVAPAFWSRAVRLTTERMRASLPLSEQEISAERDGLRAENAIHVHQLTAKIEQARLSDARQKVEINRRDGTISALERRLQHSETGREGSENARRVLEATITQRVPEIESRLMEARQLLSQRDSEMKSLQGDTSRTYRALDDAMQVNAQQRAEIDRLQMSLAGTGARTRSSAPGAETETALRAELETLRIRTREQAGLIDRLQSDARDWRDVEVAGGTSHDNSRGKSADLIQLKAPATIGDEGIDKSKDEDAAAARRIEVDTLKAKTKEQADRIETLKVQLMAYEEEGASGKSRSLSLRDSKAALKSRIAASDKDIVARDKMIAGLRHELATANERIARQASYYQEELRRLGPGGGRGNGKSKRNGRSTAAVTSPAAKGSVDSANVIAGNSDVHLAERSDAKVSLEARLAAGEALSSDAAKGFEQTFVSDSTKPEPEERTKLMDRIAGLAKR